MAIVNGQIVPDTPGGNPIQFFQALQAQAEKDKAAKAANARNFFGAVDTSIQNNGLENTAGFIGANQLDQFGTPEQKERAKFFAARNAAGAGNSDRFFNQIDQNMLAQQQGPVEAGLDPSVTEINTALNTSLADVDTGVNTARGDVTGGTESALSTIDQGVEGFDPFLQAGQNASQQQADLSGANGPEAQAAAFAAFQESPEQQFLQEQGRRQVLAGAAATGGLGSGEVQRELTRFGTGLAAQDLGNRFNRLSQVTGQGIQSAAGQGTLLGQGAGFQAGAGNRLSDIALQGGFGRAGLRTDAARFNAANRFTTGRDISTAIANNAGAQANLLNQQGAGTSDLTGAGFGNIANQITMAGQQAGLSQEQLAAMLANISQGQGSSVAGLPAVGGLVPPPNTLNTFGQLVGGVGTAVGAFNTPKTP